MLRSALAVVAGLAILVAAGRSLALAFAFVPAEPPPPGTPVEPIPLDTLGLSLLLHLCAASVAGAVSAWLAAPGLRLHCAAVVAFVGSLAAATAAVLVPGGPVWYRVLVFALAVIGPPLGARASLFRRRDAPPGGAPERSSALSA